MKVAAFLTAALLTGLPAGAYAEPLAAPVVGPMLVCFKYSSFSLADGERITDFSGGVESMAVRVEGPSGAYTIAESEIWAAPMLGRLLSDEEGTRVYPRKDRQREYAIAGVTDFSNGESRVVILLSGPAFTGTARDAQIYERFRVADPAPLHCPRTFTYSWGAALGLPDR